MLGQTADQDRDKDDVVDAEDDFQGGQGQKRDPEFGVGQPFHHGYISSLRATGSSPLRQRRTAFWKNRLLGTCTQQPGASPPSSSSVVYNRLIDHTRPMPPGLWALTITSTQSPMRKGVGVTISSAQGRLDSTLQMGKKTTAATATKP